MNGLRISQTQKLEPPYKTPSYTKASIPSSLTSSWFALYVFLFISVHSFKSFCSTSTSNFCSSERGASSLSKKAGVTRVKLYTVGLFSFLFLLKVANVYVVVNFLSQLIFIFLLFWGMVMYANEFETKEKQKLTKIKKINCNMYTVFKLIILGVL